MRIEDSVQDLPDYFQFVADGLDLCLIDIADGSAAYDIPPTEATILTDVAPLGLYETWTTRVYETELEIAEVDVCIAARLLEQRVVGGCFVAVFSLEVAL